MARTSANSGAARSEEDEDVENTALLRGPLGRIEMWTIAPHIAHQTGKETGMA